MIPSALMQFTARKKGWNKTYRLYPLLKSHPPRWIKYGFPSISFPLRIKNWLCANAHPSNTTLPCVVRGGDVILMEKTFRDQWSLIMFNFFCIQVVNVDPGPVVLTCRHPPTIPDTLGSLPHHFLTVSHTFNAYKIVGCSIRNARIGTILNCRHWVGIKPADEIPFLSIILNVRMS